jgi:ribosomal protein S18 acetylase RimI-like enzyme
MPTINCYSPEQARNTLPALDHLLQNAVDNGASIGFLPPLSEQEARDYWTTTIAQLEQGTRLLLVAHEGEQVLGSVQLELVTKPNAPHRAEVQKLMVHTSHRGQGIGRALMVALEDAARSEGRTLLVLDTREGDVAEALYRKLGYLFVGAIPQYVISEDGTFSSTLLFYRLL